MAPSNLEGGLRRRCQLGVAEEDLSGSVDRHFMDNFGMVWILIGSSISPPSNFCLFIVATLLGEIGGRDIARSKVEGGAVRDAIAHAAVLCFRN
jgi:hypothetical protein